MASKNILDWYQNCNISQILILGGYLKMKESLYIQVIVWVNTILNHIDTRSLSPRCENSRMVHILEWYWNKISSNIHTLLVMEKYKILILDTQMMSKEKTKRYPILLQTTLTDEGNQWTKNSRDIADPKLSELHVQYKSNKRKELKTRMKKKKNHICGNRQWWQAISAGAIHNNQSPWKNPSSMTSKQSSLVLAMDTCLEFWLLYLQGRLKQIDV